MMSWTYTLMYRWLCLACPIISTSGKVLDVTNNIKVNAIVSVGYLEVYYPCFHSVFHLGKQQVRYHELSSLSKANAVNNKQVY